MLQCLSIFIADLWADKNLKRPILVIDKLGKAGRELAKGVGTEKTCHDSYAIRDPEGWY
jgi:hypothetical protein